MIQIIVFLGSSASEIETEVNGWIKRNADKVTIVRIGDCVPKASPSTILYLTLVYSTEPDKLFS